MTQDFKRAYFDYLMQSQFFPAEDLKRQQLHQLEQLVRFARAKTGFYANRLDCVFDTTDTFRFDRWHEIPILRRSDLHDHTGSMFATDLPPGHGITADFTGSGSTGTPVTSRHNSLAGQAALASRLRALTLHEFDFSKNYFAWEGRNPSYARAPEGVTGGPWGPEWDAASSTGRTFTLNHIEPAEVALEFMTRHAAHYVAGRPNNFLDLATEAQQRKVSHQLGRMLSLSANLSDDIREACLETFGAKILDIYASKEVYDIAAQCPSCNNLHINAELMLVEVLDEKGNACAPGQSGHIIVTPFYNTAQPFIRYDLGDMVTLGEPCACGRTLPVIQSLDGRTIHRFRLPGGRLIAPKLYGFVRMTIGCGEWQIAQVAPEEVELRYVPRQQAPEQAFAQLTQVIRSQLTPTTIVHYKPMAKVPRAPSGKIIEVVCELPPEA